MYYAMSVSLLFIYIDVINFLLFIIRNKYMLNINKYLSDKTRLPVLVIVYCFQFTGVYI